MRSYIRNVGTNGIYNESDEIMAGQIIFCASSTIPSGYLECNGAAVSRTTYATLFAAIGSTYGPGDGATTFQLPDLRGEFIRGADRGRGVDSGRVVGSTQAGQMPEHDHKQSEQGKYLAEVISGSGLGVVTGPSVFNLREFTKAGGAQNGSENRPRNIAMIAVIKYS